MFSSLQQTPSFPFKTDKIRETTIWKFWHGHLSIDWHRQWNRHAKIIIVFYTVEIDFKVESQFWVFLSNTLFPTKSEPIVWRPAALLENVLQRYLAENLSMKEKLCSGVPINKTAGINTRPANLVKKIPPGRRFTCKYIRTFSVFTGRSYTSSAFLIKLTVAYYRAATLLRRWYTTHFFQKKKDFLSSYFLRELVFGTYS